MRNESVFTSAKVLFVCSGTSNGCCTAAIEQQARALKKSGVEVQFFRIQGKGLFAYLRAILRLKRYMSGHPSEMVHAHYGLSGMTAWLAGARPLVVSLMGSDVYGKRWLRAGVRIFSRYCWPLTIVKSREMAERLKVKGLRIIPNGVDMQLFREIPKEEAKEQVGFSRKPVILWPANPGREVKNVALAMEVVKHMKNFTGEFKMVWGKPTEQMVWYYNAADVVLITSKWEGSPNVVKEALACNVPVVSTDVGDVKRWLRHAKGCFVCPSDAKMLAGGMEKALQVKGRTNGREQIKELDNKSIVNQLLMIYAEVKDKSSSKIR
ncbi:glycosyltransferase family 4 protein [Thermophagus sp. OGC60D27]|uniref:glycosyltransferase family 4 protein n=1 Tax=Thermophagus sp. OGC60D27 TaxID=3458415 RepID=UPI004038030B